jgi:hypothetical protein
VLFYGDVEESIFDGINSSAKDWNDWASQHYGSTPITESCMETRLGHLLATSAKPCMLCFCSKNDCFFIIIQAFTVEFIEAFSLLLFINHLVTLQYVVAFDGRISGSNMKCNLKTREFQKQFSSQIYLFLHIY